jgi:hypothetical protein
MNTQPRLVYIFLIAALFIAACTTNVLNPVHLTSAPEATTSSIAPTLSLATKTPAAPNTIIPPTPTLNFRTLEIESGYQRTVLKAFWSEDGNVVYYAFASCGGCKPLKWAAYNITTHLTTTISSPIKYDPSIWKRLNVPPPI